MEARSPLDRLLRFCLENKLIVILLVVMGIAWGVIVAPFDWEIEGVPRDPVPVDAIPDTGENQQIVFTEWSGRSPQDIEDQITYPLTVALLGLPGVKTIRSNSMFGFSSIFVVFEEDIEFYWSRSRILEKLNSLPAGTLPDEVTPALGPDATPLGQVFWYTLEGRDAGGNPVGGWRLDELRSIQDWHVRYSLASVDGVAEVASIGGYVREYQVDVDPDALRAYDVTLDDVFSAVRASNVDVGARTIEVNRVEYVVRGLGFLESVDDLRQTVVAVHDNVPVLIDQVAEVGLGPALRRGALDKAGAEAVGGVVVVRYGANPLEVIKGVKEQIARIAPGLPAKTLDDGTVSRVTVVPFYDRTGLIHETLDTLNNALEDEILVTIVVVLVMVGHFGSAVLISGLLPLAVLMCFVAMKYAGVDANIVALSGIAIAIGTMVDMGVVMAENILKHVDEGGSARSRLEAVFRGASEVGSAVLTAVLTTVVGFLPVFAMEGAEGKMFRPLAFTKTFALIASIVVALVVIPPVAHLLLARRSAGKAGRVVLAVLLLAGAILLGMYVGWWAGTVVLAVLVWNVLVRVLPERQSRLLSRSGTLLAAAAVLVLVAGTWEPMGPGRDTANIVFAGVVLGGILLFFKGFQTVYERILRFCLRFKALFLLLPVLLVFLGLLIWWGAPAFLPEPKTVADSLGVDLIEALRDDDEDDPKTFGERLVEGYSETWHAFPGLSEEFMPPLDEGSYLFMPITMYHASIGEALDVLQKQDRAIANIPEVEDVVGKIGRVESPLDPAPVGMVETVVTYVSEYRLDDTGRPVTYAVDADGEFVRDASGALVPDPDGVPFRQWRDEIETPDDIWEEIAAAGQIPGSTKASKLQPIKTRQVMLATGMRAEMGVKVYGPDLETIERVAIEVERLLKQVPSVDAETVVADRVVGKPYLEIDIDRKAIARHGLSIRKVQDVIEVAVGGRPITTTVEGRERYPVRVRYLRELRDRIEELGNILVPAPDGTQIPMGQLADIRYKPGPQVIKSEDTFLTAYVTFGRRPGQAEVDVVEACQRHLEQGLELPAGVSYKFAGTYENQVRAEEKLRILLPLALFVIFMILYLQFRRVSTTFMVFSGVFVAWAGGFLLLWLYGQPWFMDFDVFGNNIRELFQMGTVNLSVAVWVGFLALFGIATDDGVIMATYLKQTFERDRPGSVQAVREAVVYAGKRRIRPCLMTVATTVLALLPVLTSQGRGSDVMVPMAIPSFGGMCVVLITVFVVPTLYCWAAERRVKKSPAPADSLTRA